MTAEDARKIMRDMTADTIAISVSMEAYNAKWSKVMEKLVPSPLLSGPEDEQQFKDLTSAFLRLNTICGKLHTEGLDEFVQSIP